MSLREVLRELSARHSYVQLHKELLLLMREEYTALHQYFAETEKPRQRKANIPPFVAVSPPAGEAPLPAEEVSGRVLANTKIRIVKKAFTEPVSATDAQPQVDAQPQADAQPQVDAQSQADAQPQVDAQSRMNSKELKAWQRQQEVKKLAELKANGIKPESLLTVENIKLWIEDQHRTFAYVAREYVGMPEDKVADFAKAHGVKSTISKKRAILSAKNRHL